jgi:hypothetical protein
MASSSPDTMLSLCAKIKGTSGCVRATIFLPMLMSCLDNFRFLYPKTEGDPILAAATHDKLYWVIVSGKNFNEVMSSTSGYETEEAALQQFARHVTTRVWTRAKGNGITLPK